MEEQGILAQVLRRKGSPWIQVTQYWIVFLVSGHTIKMESSSFIFLNGVGWISPKMETMGFCLSRKKWELFLLVPSERFVHFLKSGSTLAHWLLTQPCSDCFNSMFICFQKSCLILSKMLSQLRKSFLSVRIKWLYPIHKKGILFGDGICLF